MQYEPIGEQDPGASVLGLALLCSSVPAQQQGDYTFRVQSDLVLVNVTVRDKNGNFVRGLKPEDFTILEDNKPQKSRFVRCGEH